MLERFDPFSCDIGVLRYINRLHSSKRKFWWATGFALLPVFLLVIITLIERKFWVHDYWSRLGDVPNATFDKVFGQANSDGASPSDDGTYPLLGDFFVSSVYLLQVANLCVLYHQWRIMETFFVELHTHKVIQFSSRAIDAVNERIRSLNHSFSRIGIASLRRQPCGNHRDTRARRTASQDQEWEIVVHGIRKLASVTKSGWPLATLAFITAGYTFFLANGIDADTTFSNLTAVDAEAAYDSWWASMDQFGGNTLFKLISTCLIFYIVLQNVVGFRIAWFFISVFRGFKEQMALSVDYRTPLQRFGWQPLRQLWNTITWSIVFNFLSLLVIASVYRSWRLVPLFVLFGFSLLFLVVPPVLLDMYLKTFREHERCEAAARLKTRYPSNRSVGWRRAYQDEYALINGANVSAILGRTVTVGRWATVFGTIGTFIAIFQT